MEKKIVLSLFYTGVITALIGITVTILTYYGFFREEVAENLVHSCRLVADGYEMAASPDELEKFAGEDFRITLISRDGTVLYESDTDTLAMPNHLDRPEILEAVENGSGSATRLSDTLGIEDHYYAMRLRDGNILRVSVQTASILALFERSLPIILIVAVAIILMSVLVSIRLTGKLIAPFKKIPGILARGEAVDTAEVYPEIIPLVEEIRNVRSAQSEMRQEFTANVSHELKTPLTAISGYAELISSGMVKGEESAAFARKIGKESDRMLALISDILRLSELDSADGIALDETVDLRETAEACIEELAPAAAQRGIELRLTGEAEPVKGNRTELHEMIFNLIDNAVKYNRENGNIDIVLSGKALTVSDTGIGIPKESIPRIFERFYRVDKSRSRAGGGTGLGLSIVKHVADHHGASVSVKSTVNVGTDITVEFP